MGEIFQELVYPWVGLSPRRMVRVLRLRRAFERAVRRRRQTEQRLDMPAPPVVMVSVTTRCNLQCAYCYAATHPQTGDLPPALLERILSEAKSLGSFFFLLTGGEPLVYAPLLETIARHRDVLFLVFTNGTLITPGVAAQMSRVGNLIPLLSLDGDEQQTDFHRGRGVYAQVRRAFSDLKGAGMFFGFSATVTSRNVTSLEDAGFLDDRWEDGCRLGFYVEYFPIGRRPDPALCLTAAQRVRFRSRLQELRQRSRMFLVQFPGDEEREGGCLAAGRGLIHINAQGFVEPCPAVHWAADNLAEKSFLDCLRSPFMTQMRRRAPAPGRRQLIPIPDQHGGLHACALLGACNPLCQGQSHPHPTTLPTSGTNSGAA